MKSLHEQIRDSQKESWNKFSPGWKKWDELTMDFLGPHGEAIIEHVKPSPSDFVLDIASGTGEPGLTIAPILTDGKILITDLSEGMLEVAKQKAKVLGITNIDAMIADACDLPFEDNTFDIVSCRLGFMFFPDMLLAAKEMARVLKPGGKIATTVWGAPEKNFWATCILESINKYIEMEPPAEGAPGLFRCSESGFISGLLKQAGLNTIFEKEVNGVINCTNAEEYWNFMTEIGAPIVAALSKTDEETVEKIKNDVLNRIDKKYPRDTKLDTCGIIIHAEK